MKRPPCFETRGGVARAAEDVGLGWGKRGRPRTAVPFRSLCHPSAPAAGGAGSRQAGRVPLEPPFPPLCLRTLSQRREPVPPVSGDLCFLTCHLGCRSPDQKTARLNGPPLPPSGLTCPSPSPGRPTSLTPAPMGVASPWTGTGLASIPGKALALAHYLAQRPVNRSGPGS